ncbi:UNKNOWN [Stylonychia lemnae]|uniref:Major facilitator superfamily protein n=1 Tax=Stylonychia lemnae TaxID=5949 RepID=A0A078AXM6_STYLE|nr:UNKNOWN [Stylonychia lemnae]|eukprot:CDW85558.1 UNKNOWN [Stylonychia lemnae]
MQNIKQLIIKQFEGDFENLAWFIALFAIGEYLDEVIKSSEFLIEIIRLLMILSMIVGLIGSGLFGYSGTFKSDIAQADTDNGWGRLLQGIWQGSSTIITQAYVAECLSKDQNIKMINNITIAQIGGMILGPLLGIFINKVNFSIGTMIFKQDTIIGYFSVDITKFVKNKDLIAATNISEDEIRALYSQPPNSAGVFITMIIQVSIVNILSIIETMVAPIIMDKNAVITDNLNLGGNYTAGFFIIMGFCGLVSFYLFKKFYEEQKINKLSDRSFVFTTLIFGLLGSLALIDYERRQIYQIQLFLGFSLLSISYFIGKRVANQMFAKLIGINSTNKNHRYQIMMTLFMAAIRVSGAFWNIHAANQGMYLIFIVESCAIVLSILLMTLFIEKLSPHYSYLIEKQREILAGSDGKSGLINQRDMRLLETPEYQGLPMPIQQQSNNVRLTNRLA